MKKILITLLTACLLMSLAACSGSAPSSQASTVTPEVPVTPADSGSGEAVHLTTHDPDDPRSFGTPSPFAAAETTPAPEAAHSAANPAAEPTPGADAQTPAETPAPSLTPAPFPSETDGAPPDTPAASPAPFRNEAPSESPVIRGTCVTRLLGAKKAMQSPERLRRLAEGPSRNLAAYPVFSEKFPFRRVRMMPYEGAPCRLSIGELWWSSREN